MAKNDDELLMGTPVQAGKAARDSDGDGVSDVEEELAGTDPNAADPTLKPREADDPRADLDQPNLEREVGFDPGANLPEGQSIAGGLDGLKNVDGSDLTTGPDHHGVGMDAGPGHDPGTSPRDMGRDPTAPASDPGASSNHGPGSAPPAGAELGSRAPNMDLVGGWGTDAARAAGTALGDVVRGARIIGEDIANMPKAAREAFEQTATQPTDTPDPPKPDPPKKSSTDPDADPGSGAPTGTGDPDDIADAIDAQGGGPRVVRGHDGPQVEGDAPPPSKGDLVTDPVEGAGAESTATSVAPRGRPDDPVVHTINPDSGYTPPPTSGPGPSQGGDGVDNTIDHTAAAIGGEGLQQMDGTADVSAVVDSHLDIDVNDRPDGGTQQDVGDLGEPLDDGFD